MSADIGGHHLIKWECIWACQDGFHQDICMKIENWYVDYYMRGKIQTCLTRVKNGSSVDNNSG